MDTPPQARGSSEGSLKDLRRLTGLVRPRTHPQLADARKLAEAFYRGLGGDAMVVTAAIRRRDMVIACDLVAAGATLSEAEAYAVETSAVSGLIAPVDLRSFERERLGWLARRRGRRRESRGFIDRTGQPPSWQLDAPPMARLGVPEDTSEDVTQTTELPEFAGSQRRRRPGPERNPAVAAR